MDYLSQAMTPLGRMTLASDGTHLIGAWFDGQKYDRAVLAPSAVRRPDLPVFVETRVWLDRYFRGEKPPALPPIRVRGSDFRRRISELLRAIPYGETRTYGDLARDVARALGRPHMSAQAVGGAVGHNPISILVPCHRVVGRNGELTGYAGGLDRKRALLELERAFFCWRHRKSIK